MSKKNKRNITKKRRASKRTHKKTRRGGFIKSMFQQFMGKNNNLNERNAIVSSSDNNLYSDIQYANTINKINSKSELKNIIELYYSSNKNRQKLMDKYGSINRWDVSNISDFSELFKNNTRFNENISGWNVSNATNMSEMFSGASSFNQPLNNWNVSNVTTMYRMFSDAISFNQPLNNWNVSKVKNMDNMFNGASSFNQPLNNWNVRSVNSMVGTFSMATSFNQPLNNWKIVSVTNIGYMFYGATSFNQSLEEWGTSISRLTKTIKESNYGKVIFQLNNTFEKSGMREIPSWYLRLTGRLPSLSKPVIERKETKLKFSDELGGPLAKPYSYGISDTPSETPYVGDIHNTKKGYGG